jgi:hypothetical protein
LRESVQLIAYEATRVTNLGVNTAAGSAKTYGKISHAIHGRASHPAPSRIGLICALLVNAHGSIGHIAQLNPAYRRNAAGADRVVGHDRFMVAEVSIGEPEHQPIGKTVQSGGRPELRHTTARGWTELGKSSGRWSSKKRETRIGRRGEIDMKMKYLVHQGRSAWPFHK